MQKDLSQPNPNFKFEIMCSAGTYLKNGACALCAAGETSLEGASGCGNLCPPGQEAIITDGQTTCQPCRVGFYNRGADFCEICPTGQISSNDFTSCRDCLAGHFCRKTGSDSDKTSVKIEEICPVDTFSIGRQERCTPCPEFETATVTGSTSCKKCLPGTGYHSGECLNCLDGKFSGGQTGSCDTCPDGYISTDDRKACRPCLTGHSCMTTEPPKNVVEISASVLTPFTRWSIDSDSEIFAEYEAIVCNSVERVTSSIKNCYASRFIKENRVVVATINFDYETKFSGRVMTNWNAYKEFIDSYSSSAPVLEDVVVTKEGYSGYRENIASLQATKVVDITWSPLLGETASLTFKQEEQNACASTRKTMSKRNTGPVLSCSVMNFRKDAGKVFADFRLEAETSESTTKHAKIQLVSDFTIFQHEAELVIQQVDAIRPKQNFANTGQLNIVSPIDIPYVSELANQSSDVFSDARGIACDKFRKGSHLIEICSVETFTKEGENTIVKFDIFFKTNSVDREEILDEFRQNYQEDVGLNYSNLEIKNIAFANTKNYFLSLVTTVELDSANYKTWSSDLQNMDSKTYQNYQSVVCNKFRTPSIEFCSVSSFTKNTVDDIHLADIVLNYRSDAVSKSEALNSFNNEFSTVVTKNTRGLDFRSKKSRRFVSKIQATAALDAEWTDQFNNQKSQEFLTAETSICMKLKSSPDFRSCRISHLYVKGRVLADLILAVGTDIDTRAKVAEHFKEEFNYIEGLTFVKIRSVSLEPSKPLPNIALLTGKSTLRGLFDDVEYTTLSRSVDTLTKTSPEFVDTEAIVCSNILDNPFLTRCKVESFAISNGELIATVELFFSTIYGESQDVERSFMTDVADVDAVQVKTVMLAPGM